MPHTLLLADDSVTIQRVIELTFADEDVTVVAVGDGDQAIERLESSPPDIVLADVGMPGKSGYEVAQYIRKSPKLEHIPVVLLTGAFEPVDQARADDAKCDGVLAKPFEPQLVIGRVKELLGRSQRAAEQPPAAKEPEPSYGEPSTETPILLAHGDLDAYFDRLDTAFGPAPSAAAPGAAADAKSGSPAPPSDPDWFSGSGHNAETQHPDSPVAADAVADLPLHEPSSHADAPASREQVAEHAPVTESAAPVAAHALEPYAITDSPSDVPVQTAPDTPNRDDAPATGLAAISEHESRPIEDPRSSHVESRRAVDPVRIAQVTPALAVSPHARVRELPLKNAAPVPPLADAFAALLAAEQGSAPAVSWPASSAPATVSDATIETITRRVLDRLSDTVVRQTVSDIVSAIAERLVREEIERIKASIK